LGCAENAMVDVGYLDAGVVPLATPHRKIDLTKMIRAALAASSHPVSPDTQY
jgi:hypothetical protein